MTTERRKILFSGRVQGVGFRMTAVQLSRYLPLNGTVRNTDSGHVEIIVNGMPTDIDTLVSRLREHFGAFVRNMDQAILDSADASPTTGSGLLVIS